MLPIICLRLGYLRPAARSRSRHIAAALLIVREANSYLMTSASVQPFLAVTLFKPPRPVQRAKKAPAEGLGGWGAWGRGFHPVAAQRAKSAPTRPFRSFYLAMLSVVGCHWACNFLREVFETRILVFAQEADQASTPPLPGVHVGLLQNYDASGSGSGLRSLTG
jgi:hypothetical protein